jgi:hypothetical protein
LRAIKKNHLLWESLLKKRRESSGSNFYRIIFRYHTSSLFICGWSGNLTKMAVEIGLLTRRGWRGPVFEA